jgi:alanyl-tRNA synthetase
MTERLYYTDSALLEFDATVVSATKTTDSYHTILDRSAFYPTSGGQSHDLGSINSVQIENVVEADDGEVVHISKIHVASKGETVHGVVDRERRYLHRQIHTAQHIISQSFIRLYGFETVSVHLGQEYAAVELESPYVTDSQLNDSQDLARSIIEESRLVDILFVNQDEANELPLRKVPARDGIIRVIRIADFDWSACGGTHCTNTSQVGLFKIIGVDRTHGRPLVKFLSGRQVARDYDERFAVIAQLTRQLTCNINDLAGKYDKLSQENTELRKQVVSLTKLVIPIRAGELSNQVERIGRVSVVFYTSEFSDENVTKELSIQIAKIISGVSVALGGGKLLIAVAPKCTVKAGDLAKRICAETNLRGGGSPQLAQIGGVVEADWDRYREIIARMLADA